MVEGALPSCLATERIDWPVTTAREISSRSAKVSANLERRRGVGRIPPVLERIPCTVEWFRSKSWAICCSESPFCLRSHIKAFWLSEKLVRVLYFICNTPSAYAVSSVLHPPVESENCNLSFTANEVQTTPLQNSLVKIDP